MKVIEPITFQSSHLTYSNAVELYADWSATTTYSKGNRVHYLDHYYESLTNSNLNHLPNEVGSTNWILVGPCNHYAMFDTSISTSTISTSPLTFKIVPGKAINSIAVLNLQNANSLSITMKDSSGGTTIYTKTISLDGSIITDWYSYFYADFDIKDTVVLTDLPAYVNCELTVTLTGSGTVGIGCFIYGNYTILGDIQYGVNLGIRDFSIKDTDTFGNTVFVERAYSRRMEPDVMVDNTQLPYISKKLSKIRAKPTVWVGSEEYTYSPLVIYGFYKDWNISIPYPTKSLIKLTIEGLT